MSKIIKGIFLIAAIVFITVSTSGAYFSNTATVIGSQFSTGYWSNVVINEVYYDTGTRTFDNGNGSKTEEEGKNEWIELYNSNSFAVNIKNWSITDNSGVAHPINANVNIPAHGFALLSHDNDTWHFWGDPSGANIITVNLGGSPGSGWLGNDGDRIILKDANGTVIDQMSYGTDVTAFSPACPDVIQGHSLERNPLGHDTNTAADFIDKATPTPGS